jgi:hypothetical protein
MYKYISAGIYYTFYCPTHFYWTPFFQNIFALLRTVLQFTCKSNDIRFSFISGLNAPFIHGHLLYSVRIRYPFCCLFLSIHAYWFWHLTSRSNSSHSWGVFPLLSQWIVADLFNSPSCCFSFDTVLVKQRPVNQGSRASVGLWHRSYVSTESGADEAKLVSRAVSLSLDR